MAIINRPLDWHLGKATKMWQIWKMYQIFFYYLKCNVGLHPSYFFRSYHTHLNGYYLFYVAFWKIFSCNCPWYDLSSLIKNLNERKHRFYFKCWNICLCGWGIQKLRKLKTKMYSGSHCLRNIRYLGLLTNEIEVKINMY